MTVLLQRIRTPVQSPKFQNCPDGRRVRSLRTPLYESCVTDSRHGLAGREQALRIVLKP